MARFTILCYYFIFFVIYTPSLSLVVKKVAGRELCGESSFPVSGNGKKNRGGTLFFFFVGGGCKVLKVT